MLLAGPLAQFDARLADDLQDAVLRVRGQLRQIAATAHLRQYLARKAGRRPERCSAKGLEEREKERVSGPIALHPTRIRASRS